MEETQLLKGILEGCVLSVIARGETYGYQILCTLEQHGLNEIQEGTLYPILTRLEKNGSIVCRVGKSPFGPKRKYYTITEEGMNKLEQFQKSYHRLIFITTNILNETGEGNHD